MAASEEDVLLEKSLYVLTSTVVSSFRDIAEATGGEEFDPCHIDQLAHKNNSLSLNYTSQSRALIISLSISRQ